jgi:hypothetical protein
MERAGKIAFASLNANAPTTSPTPFIRVAIFSVAKGVHYHTFASSRGNLLMRFDSRADRDTVVDRSPIHQEGGCVLLEKVKDTTFRFLIHTPWLMALSALDFPIDQWHVEGIRAGFAELGYVVEIDDDCIRENVEDYSTMRVVIARETADSPPGELWVGNGHPQGTLTLGGMVTLTPLKIWPRAD